MASSACLHACVTLLTLTLCSMCLIQSFVHFKESPSVYSTQSRALKHHSCCCVMGSGQSVAERSHVALLSWISQSLMWNFPLAILSPRARFLPSGDRPVPNKSSDFCANFGRVEMIWVDWKMKSFCLDISTPPSVPLPFLQCSFHW